MSQKHFLRECHLQWPPCLPLTLGAQAKTSSHFHYPTPRDCSQAGQYPRCRYSFYISTGFEIRHIWSCSLTWQLSVYKFTKVTLSQILSFLTYEREQLPTLSRKAELAWQWWRSPLIPALRRQRQVELCEFKASLVYYLGGKYLWDITALVFGN